MRSPTRNGIRFLPVQTFHPEEFQRSIFFMKQLLQNMSNGKTKVVEVPVPAVRPGTALVHNAVSLVSAGTERMVVEFAEKNLLGKARSRPDLVRQVLDKARREGVVPTLEAALNRLDQPMTLGYSSTGTIVARERVCMASRSVTGWPALAAATPSRRIRRDTAQPAHPAAARGRF